MRIPQKGVCRLTDMAAMRKVPPPGAETRIQNGLFAISPLLTDLYELTICRVITRKNRNQTVGIVAFTVQSPAAAGYKEPSWRAWTSSWTSGAQIPAPMKSGPSRSTGFFDEDFPHQFADLQISYAIPEGSALPREPLVKVVV